MKRADTKLQDCVVVTTAAAAAHLERQSGHEEAKRLLAACRATARSTHPDAHGRIDAPRVMGLIDSD